MKRFLTIAIVSILIMSVGLYVTAVFKPVVLQQAIETEWTCKYGQCAAYTSSNGVLCSNCVSEVDESLCLIHR